LASIEFIVTVMLAACTAPAPATTIAAASVTRYVFICILREFRDQIIGTAACCARVGSGQATAEPPRSAMNFRRLMGFLPAPTTIP
jgi:hypothetical protein